MLTTREGPARSARLLACALAGIALALIPGYSQAQAPFDVLHSFYDASGAPTSLMRASDGTLYGLSADSGRWGLGTFFSLKPGPGGPLVIKLLHDFAEADGVNPWAALTEVPEGTSYALYGVATWGGQCDRGTVFKLTPTGQYHG